MTGQCLRTLVHEDNPPVTSVCFSPNGRYVLAFSLDSCVRLWDYIEGKGAVRRTYQGHRNSGFSIGGCFGFTIAAPLPAAQPTRRRRPSAAASKKGDAPPTGEADGGAATTVATVDAATGAAADGDDPDVGAPASAAGPMVMVRAYIAAPSEDGTIVIWDVRTKKVLQRVDGVFPPPPPAADGNNKNTVCFWVDVHGDTMAAAGQDGSVVLLRNLNGSGGGKAGKEKGMAKETAAAATASAGAAAAGGAPGLDDLATELDGVSLAAHMDDATVAAVFA